MIGAPPGSGALPRLRVLGATPQDLYVLLASCSGRIDGRDIDTDPRLDELRRLLRGHTSFAAPRSRTLTPFPDEHPRVVSARDGGWILAAHGSDSIDPEQPPRIEANR